MKKIKFDASFFLLAAILILLAAGIVYAAFTLRSDPIEEALLGDRVINTLFILDKGGKPLNSYVLMYYPATKRAAVFEIPGEVGLIVRRINRVDRIDTVYSRRNIKDFESEIESLLGIEIGFSVIIDEANLGKIVDLLEGVDIFIPAPVEIFEGEDTILFPSGVVRLDGDKARRYVTYELPEEEPEMASFRRQRFFLGFIKRLGEMNETLKSPRVNAVYRNFFEASMNQRTRFRLFDEFAGIDTDRTNIQSVGGNSREVSGQTLLLPYYDGNLIKDIVRQTLGGLTRPTGGAISERVFTVEILNGTPVNGLAGRTAELLRGFGYDIISIGNADRNDYERTGIIDRSGYEDLAKAFGDVIRCRNISSETPVADTPDMELVPQNFEYRSDFTLIIGRDFNGRYVSGE
ncbi:MAG: LCP family protein [Treponema sp.]|jgi:anionic cell wall polymer biosynthesis LytR-Cps2A-Psr (LCP) family protein|nr:LCP family protein [Treponema sp.]